MTFPISYINIIRQHKINVLFKCECFIANTNELYEDIFTIMLSIYNNHGYHVYTIPANIPC